MKKKIFFNLFSCGLPLTVKPLKDLTLFKKLFLSIIIKLYLVHLKIIELIGFFFSSTSIKEYNQIVFDDEIKETFDKNLKRKECFFYKDKNFFNWRYKNYENFFLLKIFSNKYFLGYITLVGSEAMDLKNLIIMDFQFVKELTFLQKLKLKLKILEISKKFKFDTIFTFGNQNSFMFKNILGYPFLHLPDKILPHSNPMFIHNTDSLDEEFLIKMNFTISDFDYF